MLAHIKRMVNIWAVFSKNPPNNDNGRNNMNVEMILETMLTGLLT